MPDSYQSLGLAFVCDGDRVTTVSASFIREVAGKKTPDAVIWKNGYEFLLKQKSMIDLSLHPKMSMSKLAIPLREKYLTVF